MADDRDAALLKVVSSMPSTWRCIVCHHDFPSRPDAEAPYAFETKREQQSDGNYLVKVIGDICKACCDKVDR